MPYDIKRNLPEDSKILVAMSGGVDSTVAASRLVRAGFEIVGVTMQLVPWEDISAIESARRMAGEIGIPHFVVNLSDLFEEKVMAPARAEYSSGRTPNPCVLCNRFMKFDSLFKHADQMGCTHIATGHYARITEDSSGLHLLRGIDTEKDQSYFLAVLTEKELARIIFPLGNDTKKSIRDEAVKIGLDAADRPESQDLCFFASSHDTSNSDLLMVDSSPGEIVKTDGTVVGRHDGIGGYTIGQRKGVPGGMPEKMFVVEIDPESNRVIIGTDKECYSSKFTVRDVSFVSQERDSARLDDYVGVQVRYRTRPVPGKIQLTEKNNAEIELYEPVRAITPGQIAVWYSDNEVLGAGTILEVERNNR